MITQSPISASSWGLSLLKPHGLSLNQRLLNASYMPSMALDPILRVKDSFEWHAQIRDIIRSFCCKA